MPRWSDDAPAPAAGPADAGPAGLHAASPASPEPIEVAARSGPASCSWCATPAAEGASRCGSCGAALAQRESIGDLVIPGLTAVDPALKDLDGRPLHIAGPSPSHGVASGVIVAAAAGGALGLAILGGVGAVAAAEYMGASRGKPGGKGHENVGETSEAVLQAIERLERGEQLPTADDATPHARGAQSPDSKAGTEEASHGGG